MTLFSSMCGLLMFFSKIIEEAWLHIAHSMTVVSSYHLAIWHAFGIRLQRRKLEEQPHVGLGLVDAATMIELWSESLKTYWRLTSSTILLFYKLIFPIHRHLSSTLVFTNASPPIHSPSFQSWAPSNFVATHLQPSFVELLKEHLKVSRKKKKKTRFWVNLGQFCIHWTIVRSSLYTPIEMKTFTVAMFNAY